MAETTATLMTTSGSFVGDPGVYRTIISTGVSPAGDVVLHYAGGYPDKDIAIDAGLELSGVLRDSSPVTEIQHGAVLADDGTWDVVLTVSSSSPATAGLCSELSSALRGAVLQLAGA